MDSIKSSVSLRISKYWQLNLINIFLFISESKLLTIFSIILVFLPVSSLQLSPEALIIGSFLSKRLRTIRKAMSHSIPLKIYVWYPSYGSDKYPPCVFKDPHPSSSRWDIIFCMHQWWYSSRTTLSLRSTSLIPWQLLKRYLQMSLMGETDRQSESRERCHVGLKTKCSFRILSQIRIFTKWKQQTQLLEHQITMALKQGLLDIVCYYQNIPIQDCFRGLQWSIGMLSSIYTPMMSLILLSSASSPFQLYTRQLADERQILKIMESFFALQFQVKRLEQWFLMQCMQLSKYEVGLKVSENESIAGSGDSRYFSSLDSISEKKSFLSPQSTFSILILETAISMNFSTFTLLSLSSSLMRALIGTANKLFAYILMDSQSLFPTNSSRNMMVSKNFSYQSYLMDFEIRILSCQAIWAQYVTNGKLIKYVCLRQRKLAAASSRRIYLLAVIT